MASAITTAFNNHTIKEAPNNHIESLNTLNNNIYNPTINKHRLPPVEIDDVAIDIVMDRTSHALQKIAANPPGDRLVKGHNPTGNTILHEAAQYDNDTIVKKLVACGSSVDVRNKDQDTPLMLATRTGCTRAMQALIDAGADIDAKNGSKSLEDYAREARDKKGVDAPLNLLKEARTAAIRKIDAAGAPRTRKILRRSPQGTKTA